MILVTIMLGAWLAQQQPHDAAPPPASQPTATANLLAGPHVEESKERLTLVQREFDGTLKEIDPEPDITAIGMLDLTDEQRVEYDAVMAKRIAAFDDLVRSNFGLILELASLRGGSDHAHAAEVLKRVHEAFLPFTQRGSFLDEMRPYLPDSQIAQVNAMLDEYRQAKVAELRRSLGDNATPQQIAHRARLDAFGQMVRQSIERQVWMLRERFEIIANDLNLTEEQKSKAETIFHPLAVKQLQNLDTPADHASALSEFNKILTPEQRVHLYNILLERWRAEGPTTQPNPAAESKLPVATQPSMNPE